MWNIKDGNKICGTFMKVMLRLMRGGGLSQAYEINKKYEIWPTIQKKQALDPNLFHLKTQKSISSR